MMEQYQDLENYPTKGYYTPDISDLFVGYECESQVHPYPNWVETKIESGHDIQFVEDKDWKIRTPYLTKEQIEKEGWRNYRKGIDIWFEKEGIILRDDGHHFTKIRLQYGLHDQRLKITPEFIGGDEQCFFEGKCPSINEFRKICKLLGI